MCSSNATNKAKSISEWPIPLTPSSSLEFGKCLTGSEKKNLMDESEGPLNLQSQGHLANFEAPMLDPDDKQAVVNLINAVWW